MKRIRRLLIKIVAVSLGFFLALLLAEGLATAVAYYQFGTTDVAKLHSRETDNTFDDSFDVGGGVEYQMPHPYFAYAKDRAKANPSKDKVAVRVNNVGMHGRDFPLKRDPRKFTVLLVGGSVASQVQWAGESNLCYLEQAISKRMGLPSDDVVVLSGALGAWHQPQQAILAMMYSDIADLVVSLEGFNESYAFAGSCLRLEIPSASYHRLNPMVEGGNEAIGAAWQTRKIKQLSNRLGSRAFYYLARFARQNIEASVPSDWGKSEQRLFELPADYLGDRSVAFNLEQYQKYVRTMNSICKTNRADFMLFIQPCPAIGKSLTEQERAVVGKLDYVNRYQRMTDSLLSLNDEGVQVYSLLDVFSGTTDSVYVDAVHCMHGKIMDSANYGHCPSLGYRLISEAMAEQITAAVGAKKED